MYNHLIETMTLVTDKTLTHIQTQQLIQVQVLEMGLGMERYRWQ